MLELVQRAVIERSAATATRVLVIQTQPWSYDPAVGTKESLIAEVLDALKGEIDTSVGEEAQSLLLKLTRRVKWAKALKMAALTSITLQLPKVEDVLDLVNEDPADGESEPAERGLAQFREEFDELLGSDGLRHISRVVVLVDDLDRCLPNTVVETLEAIRLFLSAKGTSFVIAADEDRVADAIQQRLQASTPDDREAETPAKLYLHKIVQTTIPLPGLSRFDTHAYLFLLLAHSKVASDVHDTLVASCAELRRTSGSLDDVAIPEGVDLAEELAVASRLTPILYEKFRGNRLPADQTVLQRPQRQAERRPAPGDRASRRRGRQADGPRTTAPSRLRDRVAVARPEQTPRPTRGTRSGSERRNAKGR